MLAAAIRTSLGKRKGSRAIFIGTRPSSDSHFFARLLTEDDPSVYAQVHTADPDASPFAVKTWLKANPALDYGLPDIEVLRAEARLAKRDPAELATFRALRLNQGTSEVESQMLIDALAWRAVETDTLPRVRGRLRSGSTWAEQRLFQVAPDTGRAPADLRVSFRAGPTRRFRSGH